MRWLALIIATEAVTEIIMAAELAPLVWLRKVASKITFFKELLQCGWCLSLWVATILLITVYLGGEIAVFLFAIHRLANLFHDGIELVKSAKWRGKNAV